MGIQGLLPALRAIEEKTNLSAFKGQRAGVDAYGWLHRVCVSCAEALGEGRETDAYIKGFAYRVRQLQSFGVVPVLVFDGDDLPSKKRTNDVRRAGRRKELAHARELIKAGKRGEAYTHFMKGLEVTPDLASTVISAMRDIGVECIVAPYEADAQLAYLAHTGYVDVVVTEDSDLVAYLTPRVLFKLDVSSGNAVLLRADRLHELYPGFTDDMFLTLFVMAGCDYCSTLTGIGLKRATELVRAHGNICRVLEQVQGDRRFKAAHSHVHSYKKDFARAFVTFRHHRVWDPTSGRMTHLSPLKDGVDTSWLESLVGRPWGEAEAEGVCRACTLHPSTLRPYKDMHWRNLDKYRSRRGGGYPPRVGKPSSVSPSGLPPAPQSGVPDKPPWAVASGPAAAAFRAPRSSSIQALEGQWVGCDDDDEPPAVEWKPRPPPRKRHSRSPVKTPGTRGGVPGSPRPPRAGERSVGGGQAARSRELDHVVTEPRSRSLDGVSPPRGLCGAVEAVLTQNRTPKQVEMKRVWLNAFGGGEECSAPRGSLGSDPPLMFESPPASADQTPLLLEAEEAGEDHPLLLHTTPPADQTPVSTTPGPPPTGERVDAIDVDREIDVDGGSESTHASSDDASPVGAGQEQPLNALHMRKMRRNAGKAKDGVGARQLLLKVTGSGSCHERGSPGALQLVTPQGSQRGSVRASLRGSASLPAPRPAAVSSLVRSALRSISPNPGAKRHHTQGPTPPKPKRRRAPSVVEVE
eukprot:Hpha_TRINITY_DN403_c0_g1::TRINITY_DN403_c0_g1_i1::g.27606::m.27606/K10746/EXO1; exonuclease 1